MLTRLDLRGHLGDLSAVLPRPAGVADAPVDAVRGIIDQVRSGGDTAVRELTARFDGVEIADLTVPVEVARDALGCVEGEVRDALEAAWANIADYHRHQIRPDREWISDGVRVRGVFRPVDRAGLYVPGGRAVYPSTVLMTAAPAKAAGVGTTVLCVPPGPDGDIPSVTLAAAAVAGVDEIYRIGGAQAVAAMAYGTESVAPVDVIVGPGNVYVATAKREVAGIVGVPSAFAGPSEVVVVADATVPSAFAAVDVILQAEHGPGGLAWLVTWDPAVAEAVEAEVAHLVSESPRRDDILATLTNSGYSVVVDTPARALEVANSIAPEHLELLTERAEDLLPLVRHAGAVFCGARAPASLGDYAAGPNHVLPTASTARFASALSVDDFRTHLHVVDVDRAGLARLAPIVETLARAEGLDAHALSVRLRVDADRGGAA